MNLSRLCVGGYVCLCACLDWNHYEIFPYEKMRDILTDLNDSWMHHFLFLKVTKEAKVLAVTKELDLSHIDFFKWKVKVKSFSRVWLFVTPWTLVTRLLCLGIFQARVLEWVAISFSKDFFKLTSYFPLCRISDQSKKKFLYSGVLV